MSNDRNTHIDELTDGVTEAALMASLESLEQAVERIVQSRDHTMMLLTQGLPDLWTAVVMMLKATHGTGKMVSVEATEVEPEQVQMVLDGRRFLVRYMELCNRCLEVFDEALVLHERPMQKPMGKAMDNVIEGLYGETFRQMTLEVGNQVALNISDVKSQTEDALSWLHDSLLYTRMLVETIIRDGHEVLKPFEVTNKDMLSAIITGFRKYVTKHHRRIEKQLRHQTNLFRPKRTSPLTPEVWGALYEVEEKAIDAAISEVLVGCAEFAFIDSREKLTMQENRELLARIMLNCIDEELFNFKDGMEVNDLLTDLTGENLPYFYERVHRRNLIQIGMFPHLKEEYEEFLKGTDHPWERGNDNDDPSTGSGQAPDDDSNAKREPAVLFTPEAMKLWEKLQEAEMIDEDFQPMLSMRKASVIASVMGGRLGLSPLWEPFETLWDAKNLANSYSQAQLGKYYGDLTKDIRNALK